MKLILPRTGAIITIALATLTAIFSPQKLVAKEKSSVMIYPQYLLKVESVDQKPLALNAHTSLVVNIEPQSKEAAAVSGLRFDARMPEHKHGMVTTPKITKLAAHKFRIDGVRLHMPGKWIFHFVISHEGGETEVFSPFYIYIK